MHNSFFIFLNCHRYTRVKRCRYRYSRHFLNGHKKLQKLVPYRMSSWARARAGAGSGKKYRKLEPLQKRTASNRNPVRKKLPFLSMKAVRMSKVQFQPSRAVNPHSFYADPDPAVLLNADGSGSRSRSSLTKFEEKKIMKSFLKL